MTQQADPQRRPISKMSWLTTILIISALTLLWQNRAAVAQEAKADEKSEEKEGDSTDSEKAHGKNSPAEDKPKENEPAGKEPQKKEPASATPKDADSQQGDTAEPVSQSEAEKTDAPEDASQPTTTTPTPSEVEPTETPKPEPSAPEKAEENAPTDKPQAPEVEKGSKTPIKPQTDRLVQIPHEEGSRESIALQRPRAPQKCANGSYAVENAKSQGPGIRLKGELGFLTSSDSGESSVWVSPLLRAWFRIMDMVAISADWGFTSLNGPNDSGDETSGFFVGNPFIGIHSVRQHGCTELRVGIGATIPLATLPSAINATTDEYDDRNFTIEAYRGALAMRGMWEWWLWVPDGMSIAFPVSWETAASNHWIGGGEVALASTVILKGGSLNYMPIEETQRALLLIPLAGKVGYRIEPVIFGMRLQMVWFANVDELQISTGPFFQLELPPGYIDARFNLNLDKPLGFGAVEYLEGLLWGLHIGGGVGF